MVPGIRPVTKLEKVPATIPSMVLLSETVAFCAVLQQTPMAVSCAPPSDLIAPPQVSEVAVMFETEAVVRVGASLGVSFLQPERTADVTMSTSNLMQLREFLKLMSFCLF